MIFRYEDLSEFLQEIRSRFRVMTFADCDGGPGILLRHDVDMDIALAHRLALLEHEADVRSTFFILTTCPLYNPCSPDNRTMLCDMSQRGFEIGLHFDPGVYGECSEERLAQLAQDEAAMLSGIIDRSVQSIALHNPSVHGRWPVIAGFRNAYDPVYYEASRYLSDSRRRFREDPRMFIERADRELLQLALHPLHYSETGEGYEHIMSRYIVDTIERVERYFEVNESYRDAVGGELARCVADRIEHERSASSTSKADER